MRHLILAAALSATALVGCSQDDTFDATITELKGGCREICPKCRPGEPCPAIACRLECNAKAKPQDAQAVACGSVYCNTGDVCCNASCGICTAPGGACIQIVCEPQPTGCTIMALCIQGYVWDDKSCSCVPATASPECKSDADCTVAADYCSGGCGCVALAPGESAPTCSDPVACFAYPCFNKTAACVSGQCQAVDATIQ